MKPSNRAVILFLWAALYFCSGYVSHKLNGPFYATGYIWLPAGVTMAAFMLRPMQRWLPVALAFFAAQLLLGWVEGRDTLRLILFSLNEIGFAAVGVALVRRAQFSLEGLVFVRALLIAGVVSSAASAAVGAAWFTLMQDVPFWRTWRVWGAADLVGVLIVLPVLAGWSRFRAMRSGGMSRADFLFGLGAFAALLLTAYFIFDQRILLPVQSGVAFALTYIPLFLAAVVTLLWGGRGGSVAVAILTLFVLYNTSQGGGPFAERSLNHGRSLLEAQLYLAVAAMLTLLISTLRTSREQLLAQSARSQNDVKLALAASEQLVYCLDPHSGTLRWSGDLERVLGVSDDAFARLDDVLAHVHDEDRARVRGRWLRESDGENRTDMLFRLMLPPGRSTMVLDMSGPLLDGDESVAVIAGAWRLQAAEIFEERDAA